VLAINQLELQLGETRILNGVTLNIAPGEQVGIIGPNGSGKTTLFNCISGFHRSTAGKISLHGKVVDHQPAHKRALAGIGRTFQNFGVFRQMTVGENILTALDGAGKSKSNRLRDRSEQIDFYLRLVGLSTRIDDKACALSGGQLRLLEIARTVAFGAELFLLDEPTAGVSPKMKGEIVTALKRLRELGKTLLIIEHDMNFIQELCDRIVVLDSGKVVLQGSAEEVRRHPLLHEIYFGTSTSETKEKPLAALTA
jgi:ABC-type branched-subunit amino acid transport system ATPase component